MFPVVEIGSAILRQIPRIIFDPGNFFAFWLAVGVTFWQYRRLAGAERRLYGVVKNEPRAQVLWAASEGVLGGVVASFILVFVGISLPGSGVAYVAALALALMLVNPRLVCFAYAGGIMSLVSLTTGLVKVDIPGLMGLIAVLHATESLLIALFGSRATTPVNVRTRDGELAGGFLLQRYWPIPLVVLLVILTSGQPPMDGLIPMPDWWPLIRPQDGLADNPRVIYTLFPVVAILGYGDLAIVSSPVVRCRRTAAALFLYSLTLMGLAIAASHVHPLQWVAALFAPLGHELVALWGTRNEQRGRPVMPAARVMDGGAGGGAGVMVLDVLPGSPAHRAGLAPGDMIVEFGGKPIGRRDDLFAGLDEALRGERRPVLVAVRRERDGAVRRERDGAVRRGRDGGMRRTEVLIPLGGPPGRVFGLIFVPEETDEEHLDARPKRRSGPVWRWLRRMLRRS
jgi:hypothetical protein